MTVLKDSVGNDTLNPTAPVNWLFGMQVGGAEVFRPAKLARGGDGRGLVFRDDAYAYAGNAGSSRQPLRANRAETRIAAGRLAYVPGAPPPASSSGWRLARHDHTGRSICLLDWRTREVTERQ